VLGSLEGRGGDDPPERLGRRAHSPQRIETDPAEGLVVDAVELVGQGEPHRGRGQVQRLLRRAAGPHPSEQLSEVHAPAPQAG
jgi:hypothetical protein